VFVHVRELLFITRIIDEKEAKNNETMNKSRSKNVTDDTHLQKITETINNKILTYCSTTAPVL